MVELVFFAGIVEVVTTGVFLASLPPWLQLVMPIVAECREGETKIIVVLRHKCVNRACGFHCGFSQITNICLHS